VSERAIVLRGDFAGAPTEPEDVAPDQAEQARSAKRAYDIAMAKIGASQNPVKALEDMREMLDALREVAMPALPFGQRPAIHSDGRECYIQRPDGRLRRMLNDDLEDAARWMDITEPGAGVHVYLDKRQLFAETETVNDAVRNGVDREAASTIASVFGARTLGDRQRVDEAVRQARGGQLVECTNCGHRSRRKQYIKCPACGWTKTRPVMVAG
jgi:rubrerythrin